ncbi:MAG: transposase [Deltaproteobacteria bacterium]|nr:transposase [Deltaproteobacteria bacterium]MBN2687806.1 transposase [Deltaproteobacteria bacterium]
MARPIRIEYEGGFYHVTSRGNARQDIFANDEDYRIFLAILAKVVERYRWIVHAYCLMVNHYHLMVETPQANLSQGMRQINGVYTQKHNRRHNRVGHLFQGRYKALVIERDSYLLELCRYIALNPVRAGLVSSPEDWPWSSYSATAGIKPQESSLDTDWLLSYFSLSKPQAHKRYSSFVNNGFDVENPLKDARGGLILGRRDFIERVHKLIEEQDTDEAVRREKYAARPSLAEIFKDTERNEGIHDAVYRWGYTLKDVGNHVGLHYSRVSKIASMMAKSKT